MLNKTCPLIFKQLLTGTIADVHAQTAPLFHQAIIHQHLKTLGHGNGIDPVFTGNLPHTGQGIPITINTLQNHLAQSICELAIDRAFVMKLDLHGYRLQRTG